MRWFYNIDEKWLVVEMDGKLFDPDTDKEIQSITLPLMAGVGGWLEFDNDPRDFNTDTLKKVGIAV